MTCSNRDGFISQILLGSFRCLRFDNSGLPNKHGQCASLVLPGVALECSGSRLAFTQGVWQGRAVLEVAQRWWEGYYSWNGSQQTSANDALTMHLLQRLTRSDSSSGRDRSRRSRRRSPSRSKSHRSGSQERELQELRAYRDHHEAVERARAEKDAKEADRRARAEEFAELEARILRAIPTPQQPVGPGANPAPAAIVAAANPPPDALPAKTKKLVEALLEDMISCDGIHTWQEIDRKVSELSGNDLKILHKNRMPETSVPRTTAARAASILAFLKMQARA